MIEKIIIIGNGESRLGISFDLNADYKIGCNAVYRDIKIDSLVCVDRRMVAEALENNFNKPIYTREEWIDSFYRYPNIRFLPDLPYQGNVRVDDPWHWSSGPHACNVAATMNPKEIHLYGFDLWSSNNNINNVYKGTENYDSTNHHAIDPRYWIYQMSKCFQYYPHIIWVQHQPNNWKKPDEWVYNNFFINFFNR